MRLLLILLLTLNLLNAKKIALLIGNSNYSFQPLANPLHDVDGIYKTLKEIGFDISKKDVLKNASKITMENALANFAQRATTAEIALIYFSGHGMQVNNINYMFPARTTATKPIHLRTLVDLDYFIQSASSAKYGIVLVDACRNNPLVKYFQNGKHKGASAKKGLGQVTPTIGQVVIGFATSAGDTADDGNGDMSPYAKALSVRLKESDDIRNILGKIGNDVSKKYEQNPIYRSNLADSVFLSGKTEKVKLQVKTIEKLILDFSKKMNSNCNEASKMISYPLALEDGSWEKENFLKLCNENLEYFKKSGININMKITHIIPIEEIQNEKRIKNVLESILKNHMLNFKKITYGRLHDSENSRLLRVIIGKKDLKYRIIGLF